MADGDRPAAGVRLLRSSPLLLTALVVAGAVGAVFGWRPAGFFLVAAVAAIVGGRLVVAVVAYRRVMRRPWPRVRPLEDDDW